MTNLERTRKLLRSDAPTVAVRAPAGCGKTFEACAYALDAATALSLGQRVLFLAHTNAAVQEFISRTRSHSARVSASTIDAFCLDVLIPYASRLGLPAPLQHQLGDDEGSVPFRSLAVSVSDLFMRSPSIARLYASAYPVVILDEHQDASPAQHDAVMSLTAVAQVKVRAFGDPMQAIYGDEDEPAIDWNLVEHGANEVTELDEPQRWPHAKELGYWVLAARDGLHSGHTLPQRSRTTPVTIHSLDAADQGFRSGNSPALSRMLHQLLDACEGSVVVLGRYNQQVLQLQVLASGRLTLNEGMEFEDAHSVLAKLEKATGRPAALARVIIGAFDRPSCGVTEQRTAGIKKCLGKRELAQSHRKELQTFVEQLRPVYLQPTLSTACAVIDDIAQNPPDWLTIRHRQCFRILGSLRPGEGSSPKDVLREAILRYKRTARKRVRCSSTIHKSKGLEFDHVILANFGATHFGDDKVCRRLAYVALSRACKSIHVIVPAKTPSPLL